jgi:hypothetical protein
MTTEAEAIQKLTDAVRRNTDMQERFIAILAGVLAEVRHENNTEGGIPDADLDRGDSGAVVDDIYRG